MKTFLLKKSFFIGILAFFALDLLKPETSFGKINFGIVEIPENIFTVLYIPAIKEVNPIIPADLKNSKIKDIVLVYLNVNEKGNVSYAKTLKGRYVSLNEAILDAIKKWEFKPYEVNGKRKCVQFLKLFQFPDEDNEGLSIYDSIRLPNIRNRIKPLYPKSAKNDNLVDEIEIKVTTNIYGRPQILDVVKGKHKILIDSATNAIKQWIHETYVLSDIPQLLKFRVKVNFPDKNKEFGRVRVFFSLENLCDSSSSVSK